MLNGLAPNILNTIVEGDCLKTLSKLPAGCVDLAFADPPFNIGYEYDIYHDKKGRDEYLSWTRSGSERSSEFSNLPELSGLQSAMSMRPK
jgi:DNA modification methylase